MKTPEPSTVPEVIRRLEAIEASAPKGDGVVCFARLYRQVTEGVKRHGDHGRHRHALRDQFTLMRHYQIGGSRLGA